MNELEAASMSNGMGKKLLQRRPGKIRRRPAQLPQRCGDCRNCRFWCSGTNTVLPETEVPLFGRSGPTESTGVY